jgi:hypothetical protein
LLSDQMLVRGAKLTQAALWAEQTITPALPLGSNRKVYHYGRPSLPCRR